MSFTGILKEWGKNSVTKVHAIHYNYNSQKKAYQALQRIERKRGKLSNEQKQKADDYAIDTLGWKGYAPWLYVYAAVSGNFREGWIPDNYYHLVVLPKIQGDYGKISFLKPLNNRLFNEAVSPDIAYYINGHWFDKQFSTLQKECLKDLVFAENNRIVYKVDQSYQGRGVFIRKKENFSYSELESKGGGTLQGYIEQHQFFSDLSSESVANIRMTTTISSEGNPALCGSYLRLGRALDTHVKSDSHVRVPIDLNSGELNEEGFLADWTIINKHPDSQISFAKRTIPDYKNCVEFVMKLHKRMPMVRCIGWDLIINQENQPILMEWNGYGNDIKFSEATQGPCFKNLEWER